MNGFSNLLASLSSIKTPDPLLVVVIIQSEIIVIIACDVCAFRAMNLLFHRCPSPEELVERNIQFTIFRVKFGQS